MLQAFLENIKPNQVANENKICNLTKRSQLIGLSQIQYFRSQLSPMNIQHHRILLKSKGGNLAQPVQSKVLLKEKQYNPSLLFLRSVIDNVFQSAISESRVHPIKVP